MESGPWWPLGPKSKAPAFLCDRDRKQSKYKPLHPSALCVHFTTRVCTDTGAVSMKVAKTHHKSTVCLTCPHYSFSLWKHTTPAGPFMEYLILSKHTLQCPLQSCLPFLHNHWHRMRISSAPNTLHVQGHHIAAQELLVGRGQSQGQYSAVVPGRRPPSGPLASGRAVGRECHGFCSPVQGRNLHRWGSAETVVMERTGY